MPVYRNGIGSEEPHRDARFEKGDVVAQNQGDGVALADPERLQPRCGPPGELEQRLARNKTIAADDLTCHQSTSPALPDWDPALLKGDHRAKGRAALHHRERIIPFVRSEEHTPELQSLMRTPYPGFCLTQT